MAVIDQYTRAMGRKFDALRRVFLGEGAALTLLKAGTPYTALLPISAGWFAEFSEFYGRSTFKVADTSAEFAAVVRKASHLVVTGSDVGALNGRVYKLRDDTQPPLGSQPFWKLRADATDEQHTP